MDDRTLASMFQRRLLPGERLVWTGAPLPGIAFRPMDALLVPFSLLWGGFAIFWNGGVWVTHAPPLMRLFGLPFLIVGLYLIFGRFWLDAVLRRRTAYAVTDRRILIAREGFWPNLKSLDLRRLPALELSERKDGTGALRFGASPSPFGGGGSAVWSSALDPTPHFDRIRDVRRVFDLIQREADRAVPGPA